VAGVESGLTTTGVTSGVITGVGIDTIGLPRFKLEEELSEVLDKLLVIDVAAPSLYSS